MCSLCRLPVAKNHNFGQILTSGGLLYRPPFTDEGQIWCAIAGPRYTLTCQISLRLVYSVALLAQNPNFSIFWTLAFTGVAKWQQSEEVEYGCITTRLPLSNGMKIVSVLQYLHGEIGAHNLWRSEVWRTNGQTDIQKNWTFLAAPAAGEIRAHQTWHSDRGPRARSCTSKTSGGLTHSFAARGRWKFEDNQTPST